MADINQDPMPQPVRARRYLWGLAIALATACVVALVGIRIDDQSPNSAKVVLDQSSETRCGGM